MNKNLYVVVACAVLLSNKVRGQKTGLKTVPENVGGIVLQRSKEGSIILPVYQFSGRKHQNLRRKAHGYVDLVFDSLQEMAEVAKVEETPKKDLPLLIGTLKWPESQKTQAKRMK